MQLSQPSDAKHTSRVMMTHNQPQQLSKSCHPGLYKTMHTMSCTGVGPISTTKFTQVRLRCRAHGGPMCPGGLAVVRKPGCGTTCCQESRNRRATSSGGSNTRPHYITCSRAHVVPMSMGVLTNLNLLLTPLYFYQKHAA